MYLNARQINAKAKLILMYYFINNKLLTFTNEVTKLRYYVT